MQLLNTFFFFFKVLSYSDILCIFHICLPSINKWHWKSVKAKNINTLSFPRQSERPSEIFWDCLTKRFDRWNEQKVRKFAWKQTEKCRPVEEGPLPRSRQLRLSLTFQKQHFPDTAPQRHCKIPNVRSITCATDFLWLEQLEQIPVCDHEHRLRRLLGTNPETH